MNRVTGMLFVCFLFLGLSAGKANGQQSTRDRVTVTCTCDDATGQAYAAALHDALAKSSRYREVGLSEGVEKNAIRISIVSLPLAAESNSGQTPRAALSIVCLHDGAILHQFVETCTKIPIKDCAESMLADLLKWA